MLNVFCVNNHNFQNFIKYFIIFGNLKKKAKNSEHMVNDYQSLEFLE